MNAVPDVRLENGMAGQKRVVYLDFLRCLAIVLVIVLHSIASPLVTPAYYQSAAWYLCMLVDPFDRAAVPIFFMISGALMLNRPSQGTIGAFYRHNLPKLLVPLAAWSVIYYGYNAGREHRPLSLAEFFNQLFSTGTSFHMWFIYSLLGLYLLCPFLRQIADHAAPGQLWGLWAIILLPTTVCPLLSGILPITIAPLESLMTGWAGFFLLRCLLDRTQLSPQKRIVLYLGGAAGYAASLLGNLSASSAEAIRLPMDANFLLNHYLLAAAIFVGARAFFAKYAGWAKRWAGLLAKCSNLVFGVFWVHVLILYILTD